jgi:Rap1a immunity proteins
LKKPALVIFALIVTLVLWFAPTKLDAKVGEFTGEDYLQQCTSTDPSRKPRDDLEQAMAVYCVGYIDAAVTMIALMDGRSFCLPKGTTPQDIITATTAFLQAHPDQKQQLLARTMIAALQSQWPCKV